MTKRGNSKTTSPEKQPKTKKTRVEDTLSNESLTIVQQMDWTLERARSHWVNLLENADDNAGYKQGCAFLKGVIDCTESVRVFDGDDNHRQHQYKEFIKYVNTLNLVEKIHPTGKIQTLAKKILEQVPGFWILNEESERVLNMNSEPVPCPALTNNEGVVESAPGKDPVQPQPNPDHTDQQGEPESAPEVATVHDMPLLDETRGAGDTIAERVNDVSSVPDKNILESDVRTVEGCDKSLPLEGEKERIAARTTVQGTFVSEETATTTLPKTSVPEDPAKTTLQGTSVPEMPLLEGNVPEESSFNKVAAKGSEPTKTVEPVIHDDKDDDDDDMEWDGVTTPGKNSDPRKIAPSNQPIVGSRDYWETIIFPEHAIKENTIGFDFLEDLLAGKTSITDSGESRSVREEQYRQLINLYNSLKQDEKIPTTGNVKDLMNNILTNIPGMSTLDDEAQSYYSNEDPEDEKDRDDGMEVNDVEDADDDTHINDRRRQTRMMSPKDIGRRIAASITQSQTQMDTSALESGDSVNKLPTGNTQTPQSRKSTVTHEAVIELPTPVKLDIESKPIPVLKETVKPFNRSAFIFKKKDDSDVNKLLKDNFTVISVELTIEEMLNMLCYHKGEILVPKVNHHFVTKNQEYHELKNAFELEIRNGTTLLNNKLYVACFKVTSSEKGSKSVPLYTIQGKPKDKLSAQFVFDEDEVNEMIDNIKQGNYHAITDWSKAKNIIDMKSIHIAPADGNHRTMSFDEFAKDVKTAYLLEKGYKLQVKFLLPKDLSKPPSGILQDFDQMSDHVMKITKKGKEHSIWDALQSVFNLMETELEKVSSDNKPEMLYTGRPVTVKIHDAKLKRDVEKQVPAFLYCKEPSSIYKAFGDIFGPMIKALLRQDDLKSEWMSYYTVDEDRLYQPLALLDCHETLHKFTTFMGTDTYNKFKNARQSSYVKLKIKHIDLPFQLIQIFHVILTAAMSKNHFKIIKSSLKKMDSKNLLTLPRLLTIVSSADDLTNHPSLVSKKAPNIKRARKVYHSMLLLSMFEGYATHGPFPTYPEHFCYKIRYTNQLSKDLKTYDAEYKSKVAQDDKPSGYVLRKFEQIFYHDQKKRVDTDDEEEEGMEEEEEEEEEDEDDEGRPRKKKEPEMPLPKEWLCSTDVFFHYYKEYINLITSTKWFQKSNKLLAPFLKHLSRTTKLSTQDLALPENVQIEIRGANSRIIPFSFNAVMSALFEHFPDDFKDNILMDASVWRIDDMTMLNKYFGFDKPATTTADTEGDTESFTYTNCKDMDEFKQLSLREYELQTTKQSRKKEIAKTYFVLDQSGHRGFAWCNAKPFLKQLHDPEYKETFDYTTCGSFKAFQIMAYLHYNLPSTSQGKQTSIATAYMSIDIATNVRGVPFENALPILEDLNIDKAQIFDPYNE